MFHYFQNILNEKGLFARVWVSIFFDDKLSKITLKQSALYAYILVVIIFAIRKSQGKKENKKVSDGFKVLTDPLETILRWSSDIIQKPIKTVLDPKHGVSYLKIKDNYQSLLGATIIAIFFYLLTITIVALMDGVSIETFNMLFQGSIDDKIHVLIKFVKENVFFNLTVITLYFFSLYYRTTSSIMETDYQNASMAGLFATLPISQWDTYPSLKETNKELINAFQKQVSKILSDENVGKVQIKMASGFDSFGTKENPGFLINTIKSNSNVSWQILLLNPDGEGASLRGNSYLSPSVNDKPIESLDDYKTAIKKVINHLLELRQTYQLDINIKVYSHNPVWKFFLLPKVAIVQAFGRGDRSDYTPAFFLEKNDTSLYHGYQFTFKEVWHESSAVETSYDLND